MNALYARTCIFHGHGSLYGHLVAGTAYPYLEVDPTVVRFRVLNAADDRFFALHMYVARPFSWSVDGRRC